MARKMSEEVLEKIKPETLLEAKIRKLKLFYFRDIMRKQDSFENIIMLDKLEDSRKRGRLDMK